MFEINTVFALLILYCLDFYFYVSVDNILFHIFNKKFTKRQMRINEKWAKLRKCKIYNYNVRYILINIYFS